MVMNLVKREPHVVERYDPDHPYYVIGLDIGQANDPTAIAVVERRMKKVGWPYMANVPVNDGLYGHHWERHRRYKVENQYHIRHLERLPLRTPYTRVVDKVLELIKKLFPAHLYPVNRWGERGEVVLIVDYTGVGRAVVDMLYQKIQDFGKGEPNVRLWPAAITGSQGRASFEPGPFISLPKHELIFSGGVIPLQDGRLKWGPKIRDRKVLEDELKNYRRNQNIATGAQTFEPWREGEHDDLLFAVCLAGWAWRRFDLKFIRDYSSNAEIVPEPEPEPADLNATVAPGGHTPLTHTPLPPDPDPDGEPDPSEDAGEDEDTPKPSGAGLSSAP